MPARWLDLLNRTGFFGPLSLQGLSLFRVGLAIFLAVDYAANLSPDFEALYTKAGVRPSAVIPGTEEDPLAHVADWLDAAGASLVVPIIYPIFLIAFAAGLRTRAATLGLLGCYTYIFWRNITVVSGVDQLVRLLLLWSVFLPLNRYWSVDAALDNQPRTRACPAIPATALRLQIVSLYFFSGLFKLGGPPWLDGSAIGMTLLDSVYGARPLDLFLVAHAPGLLTTATYATTAFQLAVPLLVYSPWRHDVTRSVALVGLIAMHMGILLCLQIGGFPYLSLLTTILLVPERWWTARFAARRARLARVEMFYEPTCAFCRRVAVLLREMCLTPETPVRRADVDADADALLRRHGSWVVRDGQGHTYLKWRAVAYVLRQQPFTWWLGWLTDRPALRPAMARVYDAIGRHRGGLGAITRVIAPFRDERQIGRGAQMVCFCLAVAGIACNLDTAPAPAVAWFAQPAADRQLDERFNPTHASMLFDLLQVTQRWSLFAPVPVSADRRYAVNVIDPEGLRIDVLPRLGRSRVTPVQDGTGVTFADLHWVHFYLMLDQASDSVVADFGAYLCRQTQQRGLRAVRGSALELSIDARQASWPATNEAWINRVITFQCADGTSPP